MIINYMKQWMSEYFNGVLQKVREDHLEYYEAIQECNDGSEKIKELLLQKDSLVQAYVDAISDRSSIEQNLLYLQGMKDCFSILKCLGAFVREE